MLDAEKVAKQLQYVVDKQ